MPQQPRDHQLRAHLAVFAANFLPFLALITVALLLLNHLDREQVVARLQQQELQRVQPSLGVLERGFAGVVADLQILANSDAVRSYLLNPDTEETRRVTREFALFSLQKRLYDQIRVLGPAGHERVRVDYRDGAPYVVPANELQDKSSRYYFRDTARLGRGAVFVSPLDLNTEHGRVEQPFKPVVRFATPLLGADGKLAGELIINYRASGMLRQLGQGLAGGHGDGMLLDGQGYWLYDAVHPQREWGFMFGDGVSFAASYPEAWSRISALGAGQVETPNGLFTFASTYPLRNLGRGSAGSTKFETAEGDIDNYRWTVVSHLPEQRLAAYVAGNRTQYLPLYFISLLLMTLLAIGYTRLRVSQRETQEAARLAARVVDVTRDGVAITDAERRIVSVNRAFTALTGYLPAEVQGRDIKQFHADHYDTEHFRQLWSAVEASGHWQGELWYHRRNGEYFAADVSVNSVANEDGKVGHYMEVFSDISDRNQLDDNLQRLAQHDSLTGLPNRILLLDRLTMALARARRDRDQLALLFVDVDDVKSINDHDGQAAGDAVLKAVAERMQQACTRAEDTVARFGGDEFVILLPRIAGPQSAADMKKRLYDAVTAPVPYADRSLTIDASIGIALYPSDGATAEGLLSVADQATYSARRSAPDGTVN